MLKKLKSFNQWVISNPAKSKEPLQINGRPASVTNSSHWSSYKDAIKAVKANKGTHVGFVFTSNDPFCVYDFDNKQNDPKVASRINLIVSRATDHGHYCETSFSGLGYHVIYEGTQLTSRRRGNVEYYTSGRYIIITEAHNKKPVSVDKEGLFDELYVKEFPDDNVQRIALIEIPQTNTDQEVLERFRIAKNGEENSKLYDTEMDGDQSQLDQSLIERLCFYTDSNEQVRRLFKASKRGERPKVVSRGNEYINRSIQHSRAVNIQPEVTIDIPQLSTLMKQQVDTPRAKNINNELEFPPGLAGLMSQFFYINSVQPIKSFAIANVLTTLAGIVGRRYSFRGTTINIFTLIIGRTGSGKDASRKPLFKLKRELENKGMLFGQFMGPEAASGQALFATLADQPCYSVYTGEMADDLLMMSDIRASENNRVMCNAYLRLYDEGDFGGKVHRDSKNNVQAVERPAVTLMGSGTPDFFETISDHAIKRGLIPRFIIIEYKGKTPAFNDNEFAPPHPDIIKGIRKLIESCVQTTVIEVPFADALAEEKSMEYRSRIVTLQDRATTLVEQGLYNRVHLNICRVASILAATENPSKPVITLEILEWAHSYLMYSLENLIQKFTIGDLGGNGATQRDIKMLELFTDWYALTARKRASYSKKLMDFPLFVPRRYLNARCKGMSCFTKDVRGFDRSFKETLYNLEANEEIRPVSSQQKNEHGIQMLFLYARKVDASIFR